jgi:hypothetical protein
VKIRIALLFVISLIGVSVFAQQVQKPSADALRVIHRHKELSKKLDRATRALRRKYEHEIAEVQGLNIELAQSCQQGYALYYSSEICVSLRPPTAAAGAPSPNAEEKPITAPTPAEREAARQKKEQEDTQKRIERENGPAPEPSGHN